MRTLAFAVGLFRTEDFFVAHVAIPLVALAREIFQKVDDKGLLVSQFL